MNIVITGSLSNISKPLVTALITKGYSVTVISSNPENKNKLKPFWDLCNRLTEN